MNFCGKNIYFLGIGGVSMSSLAIMLKERGCFVDGSDEAEGRGTDILKERKIEVDFQICPEKIENADLVVFSSAIKDDNPQMILCKKMKKKLWTRGQLLGAISDEYENVIAVAGSHGKTTTTALIFEILQVAGVEPTLHLGGFRVEDGLNFHLGDKEFFVTEACEYHNNFLNLHPYISVVTNIEKEHMDFFKTFSNQLKSFEIFKKQSKIVVDNFCGIKATHIRHDRHGGLLFTLVKDGLKLMDVHMHICEEVNTQNCIYAYLVAKKLGINDCIIKKAFENFKGVSTRFERMRCPFFDVCICDYAHHPTEIQNAISTAKKLFKNKELVTIFQPHTYSRTQSLLPQFVDTFKGLKHPLFFRTYSAREKASDGISALQFAEILQKSNKNAKYFDNFDDLRAFLMNFSKEDAALLFLGAGDLPSILHKNLFVE